MQLRPRQEIFVDRCLKALNKKGQTVGIAATGFGKTISLSAIIGRFIKEGCGSRVLVLQHRTELTSQNSKKFRQVNPKIGFSIFDADYKDMDGEVVFSMIQTMCREQNLEQCVPFDLVVIDECHRAPSNSYLDVLQYINNLKLAQTNNEQGIKLLGVTATPDRGDSKTLRQLFTNIADEVPIGECIRMGFLVKPRTFTIDLGIGEQLKSVSKKGDEYDMVEVDEIMNVSFCNDTAVLRWKEIAGDRKTVVFCATVQHAKNMCQSFINTGINAEVVTGSTPKEERKTILNQLGHGNIQVVLNVAVLTEGWDCPPISCVVMARLCSQRNTAVQMIGRGLRTVNPEEYPGVEKEDCIIIDLGNTLTEHGSALFEQGVGLGDDPEAKKKKEIQVQEKICPQCEAELPPRILTCPFCAFDFGAIEEEFGEVTNFELREINIFNQSPYKWESFWNDAVYMACAFDAWAVCVKSGGKWHVIGGRVGDFMKHIMVSDKAASLAAADDYLRQNGDTAKSKKTKDWLKKMPTEKQCKMLGLDPYQQEVNRYRASCMLQWKFNKKGIELILREYQNRKKAA